MMSRWHNATWIGALLALAGCVGSSVPLPPQLMPVDPDLLDVSNEEVAPPRLIGAAGSVVPDGEVWIWDLEAATPPVVALADADGAFSIEAPGSGELRLQVRLGADRSPSVDIRPTIPIEVVERPGCVSIPRDVSLGEDRRATLEVENGCDEPITIEDTALRALNPDLTVTTTVPAALPPGARLEIAAHATGVATEEDILFVYATVAGETVRYPVSLIARSP